MAINLNLNHSISREVLEISVVFSRRLFLCVYLSQNIKIRKSINVRFTLNNHFVPSISKLVQKMVPP